MPLPPPGCTTPAHTTSTPGCREVSSSCPLLSKVMQPNTRFSWSETGKITTLMLRPATPQLTQSHPGAVQLHQWTSHPSVPWIWEGTDHRHVCKPVNLHFSLGVQPNRKPESWTRQRRSHQTWSQPPGRSANDLPAQKKRRLGKSLCQKPSKTDIPDQLCTFTAFLDTTSGVK